jgi:hypothetical protein
MNSTIHAPLGGQTTETPNATAASVAQEPRIVPEFLRLPRPGQLCPWTGLSRTALYLLVRDGRVRSHSMRRRGTVRGTRLIDYQSVCDYIRRQPPAEQQEARAAKEGERQ